MSDMVDLVFVQADALHQIDLDLIGRRQPAQQILARRSAMLGHRQHRRDVVAGVGIVRGQKRIVEIEFADRDAIGPCRPFRLITLTLGSPKIVAPCACGCASACARAVMTGCRAIEAAATAALSMMRLPIISATSSSMRTGSAATDAIFQAS